MGNLSIGTPSSYADWAKRGKIYSALSPAASVVAYTGTAVGGPLLWNSSGINGPQSIVAYILGIGAAVTTASAAATMLGIGGAGGQTAAPTSTGAIPLTGNNYIGGGLKSGCNLYNFGTVTNAATTYFPTHTLDTGAITVSNIIPTWVDVGGAIIVPPGSWAAPLGAAGATSAVVSIGLVWCEIPL